MRKSQRDVMRSFLAGVSDSSTDGKVMALGRELFASGERIAVREDVSGQVLVRESPRPWIARRVWELRKLLAED